MIKLAPDAFHALLPALRRVPINHLFARSVLEHKVKGEVWVDRADHPSLMHIVHSYGMTLLFGDAGAIDPAVLEAHLLALGADGTDKWLQASPEALPPLLDELLDVERSAPDQPPGGARVQRYTRQNFQFNPTRYALKRNLIAPPDDIRLRPLLATDFALADIGVSPQWFWTSADQFLANGGGWCVERDGELASMAFCSYRFDRQLEIGVETRAQYRGRRYALHAACALIDQCISQGLEPVWSCRKENQGSYRLAQSLGFEPTMEIPYYRLPAIVS